MAETTEHSPRVRFSTTQRYVGIIIAVILVWALYTAAWIGLPFAENWVADVFFGLEGQYPHPRTVITWITLLAVIGLPIALIFGVPAGYFAVKRFEARGRTSPWDAFRAGAIAALAISLMATSLDFLFGLSFFLGSGHSASYRWGYLIQEDGMLTFAGWVLEIGATLRFIVIGGFAAWVARCVIGPPRKEAKQSE